MARSWSLKGVDMSMNPKSSAVRHYSDMPFEWRPGRIYIPAWQFSGLDYEATTATDIKSMDSQAANTTSIGEVSTFGITGLTMTTATDRVNHLMQMPYDLDPKKPVFASVYWTANETSTSNACTWIVTYKPLQANVTALAAATTALDTTIAAQSYPTTTAYTLAETAEGVIKAGTIAETTDAIIWRVEMNTETVSGSAIFLGLCLRYTPRRMRGPDGMAHSAKKPYSVIGSHYSF